jgi:hypothetical protein
MIPVTWAGQDQAAKYSVGVPDQKPPFLVGSEADTLRALLQFRREFAGPEAAGQADILRELIDGRTGR